jgi:hypothetical protein
MIFVLLVIAYYQVLLKLRLNETRNPKCLIFPTSSIALMNQGVMDPSH